MRIMFESELRSFFSFFSSFSLAIDKYETIIHYFVYY